MKKTLKKDITRYDKKMQLRVDGATFKAAGIALVAAIPLFLILNVTAGMIPAVFLSLTIGCLLLLLQIGKIDGISLAQYLGKLIKFAFFPKERKKHYSHDSGEYRIKVMTERELRQKERKNTNGKKKGK